MNFLRRKSRSASRGKSMDKKSPSSDSSSSSSTDSPRHSRKLNGVVHDEDQSQAQELRDHFNGHHGDHDVDSNAPPPPPPPHTAPAGGRHDDELEPPPPPPPPHPHPSGDNGKPPRLPPRKEKEGKVKGKPGANPVLAGERSRGRSHERDDGGNGKAKGKKKTGGKSNDKGKKNDPSSSTSLDARSRSSTSPGPRVDAEHVDFTIVPLLLRSGMNYEKANEYGEILKGLSKVEVDTICTTPKSLVKDLQSCGFEVPAEFERALQGDLFWAKANGGKGSRKSFVYYRGDTPNLNESSPSPSPAERRVSSMDRARARTSSQARARQSFAVGQQMVGLAEEKEAATEESNPNRYKVQTRKKQAESISQDLQDLMGALNEKS